MRKEHKRQTGFSLAEAMLATVILAIAAAGVLIPFSSAASVQAEGNRRTLGVKLASDLMEEIISTPYDRASDTLYDNRPEKIVANYNWCEEKGQVKKAGSSSDVFSGGIYPALSRDVTCVYYPPGAESDTARAKFVLATVRVFYNGKEIASLSRLIGK
jgi:hypothetical protein